MYFYVGYLLYCTETGALWYGQSASSSLYHAHYEDEEHPFEMDEQLGEEIQEWVSTVEAADIPISVS